MGEEIIIERVPVNSTNMVSIGYHSDAKVMHVEFGNGVYEAKGVSQEDYDALMGAASKGSHFHRELKSKYDFKKI